MTTHSVSYGAYTPLITSLFGKPWYGASGIIVAENTTRTISINVSNSFNQAQSNYNVEITYWNGQNYVTETHAVVNDLVIDVEVGAGASNIYFQAGSALLTQNITISSSVPFFFWITALMGAQLN